MGIVGPGRAGIALAVALRRAGLRVLGLHGRRARHLPAGLRLSTGPVVPWLGRASVVILAVRDDAVAETAAALARDPARLRGRVFLHLSGALTSAALAPLRRRGACIGGMHPLMTVSADPRSAPAALRGATFALEGDPAAVRAARPLVRTLGGVSVIVPPRARARYHAGAVFASNYVVVLIAEAERLLASAGFSRTGARAALAPLARAALQNAAALGPEAALTGPLARGDAATVRRHLAALPAETRALYRALAAATVRLARRAGGPRKALRAVEAVLRAGR